jgi:HAD superfamily hydrolase (TIGR01509 family)
MGEAEMREGGPSGRVKAILWDNDGVLVDTEGLYYEATRQVLIDFGVELTPAQYRRYCLHDNRGAWHLAQARGISRRDIDSARERRNDRYSELLQSNPLLIDGVRETLGSLHGHVTMGVATSSTRRHFDLIHESIGLTNYLDFVITADDVTETKPNPELYLKALIAAKAAAEDCIVVEDSPRGLRAAVSAGVPCYIIPTEWTSDGEYSSAAGVLGSVRDVPTLVLAG